MSSRLTVEQLLLDDSFIRYCLTPDAETTQKWERMYNDHADDQEAINEAKALVRMLSPALNDAEISEEVHKLRDMMEERETAIKRKSRISISKLIMPAAIIMVVACIAFFALKPLNSSVKQANAVFHTKVGEQKRVVLPDGTVVILNSNTRLTYDKTFNETTRVVHLTGKAFFDVAKNRDKPFSVYSNRFSTTALGTSFYVISDSSDNYSVKLLEGKVKIIESDKKRTAFLNPGEEINWKTNTTDFEKTNYDTAYLNKWISGKIVFDKTPVHEAVRILERWYGVDIIISTENKSDVTINGTYQNVSLEDILEVICFSVNCQIKYDDDNIIIQ